MNKTAMGGRDQLLQSQETENALLKIEARIKKGFEERLLKAGWLDKILLKMDMHQEIKDKIRQEKEQITPSDALYLKNNR